MNEHSSLISLLTAAEGNIPHMYLDTRGFVTVGIGHMLPSADAAAELQFLTASNAPALAPVIRMEWEHLKIQKPAQLARYYATFCGLHLAPETILAILDKDIAVIEQGVSNHFGGFADYPPNPQDALLDMAFNLGVGGLSKYTKLRAAAQRKDWRACADECHRNGISEDRNNATKLLFLSAAAPEKA